MSFAQSKREVSENLMWLRTACRVYSRRKGRTSGLRLVGGSGETGRKREGREYGYTC